MKKEWICPPLTNETLNNQYELLKKDSVYGVEMRLIEKVLTQPRFQTNKNREDVALKIALIDVTNSTHLHQHKKKINIYDLAEHIMGIENIDELIKNGDPRAVNAISKTGEVNLFSFASKFCFCHNTVVYKKDDYAKYDTLVNQVLPTYLERKGILYKGRKVTSSKLTQFRKEYDYAAFNDLIAQVLEGISTERKRAKFDNLMWYPNRGS